MATRLGLIRAREGSRTARLLLGQQKQQQLVSSSGHHQRRSTLLSSRNLRSSTSTHAASLHVLGFENATASALCRARGSPQSLGAAGLSSKAKPSQEDSEGVSGDGGQEDGGRERLSFEESRFNPALGCYPWEEKEDRRAKLDDGDEYGDFVDLRLEEVGKLFPEGLAGGTQGGLERATTRGVPLALLRREAAGALIHSLDGFADGGEAGVEGTSGEKWREYRRAQHTAAGMTKQGKEGEHEGLDVELGDVQAAAAEAEAAAAAVAQADAKKAKATAEVEEAQTAPAAAAAAGGEVGEADGAGSGGAGKKKVLGSGPIWEEMKTLAESKRKPLRGVRRVVVQPRQRSYLLAGKRGSGKSCVLNQIVLHARSTGWIVLFVPDGRNLVQKGIYCQPSPVFENLYDLPIQSLKRLKTLRDAHADQLKDIQIKDPKVLARHAGAKNLLELLDLGVDNEELAGTVHYDVMRELLATTEAKVLLAIDEYNELFQSSHWHYGEEKLEAPHLTATLPLVPPLKSSVTGLVFADEDLASLAHPETDKKTAKAALPLLDAETGGRCLPPPPANGIVVCATSARYPPVKKLKKNKKWASFEEVAGRLAKAALIPVEPYARNEFLRVIKRYARVEDVIPEPLTNMEVVKVHAKSDGLAEWVFDTCRSGHYRISVPE